MGKYAHIRACSLCGEKHAVMNSTWHISGSYRKYYCRDCTDLLLIVERILKRKVLRVHHG